MCETHDLGITWPQWHTLMFEGQDTLDMRVVCPQYVKKMLLKQARTGGWFQKRMYDIGWSGEKKCRGCNKEEGTEKHRLYHCPCWKSEASFHRN